MFPDLFYLRIVGCLFSASSIQPDLCHPDWKVTKMMTLARFTWPKAGQNIKLWSKECLQCQQNKILGHTKTKTCQINDCITRFSHIHLDIVGQLSAVPDSPQRYLVTFTDRMTKWIEAQPVSSTTADVISDVFLNSWFSRFGMPLYITTDRGSHVESELFECLAKTVGFCRLTTTAYHPQSNSQIERFHRTLKEALKSAKSDWLRALPIVLFRTLIKPDEVRVSTLSATTGLDVLIPNSIVNDKLEKWSFEYIR